MLLWAALNEASIGAIRNFELSNGGRGILPLRDISEALKFWAIS